MKGKFVARRLVGPGEWSKSQNFPTLTIKPKKMYNLVSQADNVIVALLARLENESYGLILHHNEVCMIQTFRTTHL